MTRADLRNGCRRFSCMRRSAWRADRRLSCELAMVTHTLRGRWLTFTDDQGISFQIGQPAMV